MRCIILFSRLSAPTGQIRIFPVLRSHYLTLIAGILLPTVAIPFASNSAELAPAQQSIHQQERQKSVWHQPHQMCAYLRRQHPLVASLSRQRNPVLSLNASRLVELNHCPAGCHCNDSPIKRKTSVWGPRGLTC